MLLESTVEVAGTDELDGHVSQLLAGFKGSGAVTRHPTHFVLEREVGCDCVVASGPWLGGMAFGGRAMRRALGWAAFGLGLGLFLSARHGDDGVGMERGRRVATECGV